MLPKKQPRKAKVAMKVFHWSKIPDRNIEKSIWKNLDDTHVKLDESELELLFNKPSLTRSAISSSSSSSAANAPPKEVIPQLLDGKRAADCGIMLFQFGSMGPKGVADAIRMCSGSLTGEKLKALLNFVPTSEERETLTSFEGDPSKQSKQEQFFLEIVKIPRLEERLRCLLFMQKAEEQLSDIMTSLSTLKDACNCVQKGKALKQTLEIVLALGNFLNGTTAQGCAYGVKLDTLRKMKEFKSTPKPAGAASSENAEEKGDDMPLWMKSGTITLFQYLVHAMEKRGLVSALKEECKCLKDAAQIPLSSVQQEANEVNEGVNLIMNELKTIETAITAYESKDKKGKSKPSEEKAEEAEKESGEGEGGEGEGEESSASSSSSSSHSSSPSPGPGSEGSNSLLQTPEQYEAAKVFLSKMQMFYDSFLLKQANLSKTKEDTENAITETTTMFNEDPKKVPSEEFFSIFVDFLVSVDKTSDDIKKKEEKERKDREKREREERKKLGLPSNSPSGGARSWANRGAAASSASSSSPSSSASQLGTSASSAADGESKDEAKEQDASSPGSEQKSGGIGGRIGIGKLALGGGEGQKDIMNAISQQIASGALLRRNRGGVGARGPGLSGLP